MEQCYLCSARENALQLCIVCERCVCQRDIPSDIQPGESVICRGCDRFTPNRAQAHKHFWMRQGLKYGQQYPEIEPFRKILARIVQTNGTALCHDRYCHDDEWTYCIFCEEGDFDPHEKRGWKHKPDCILFQARALLDATDVAKEQEE